jgi:hypothetical protein
MKERSIFANAALFLIHMIRVHCTCRICSCLSLCIVFEGAESKTSPKIRSEANMILHDRKIRRIHSAVLIHIKEFMVTVFSCLRNVVYQAKQISIIAISVTVNTAIEIV